MKRSEIFPLVLVCVFGAACWYLGYLIVQKTEQEGEHAEAQQKISVERASPAKPAVPVVESPVLALLHDPSRLPVEDIRLLEGLIVDYLLMAKGNRRPIGLNEDVVFALTEPGRFGVRFMSPVNPAISGGRLIDRWGEPYHVHAVQSDKLELRSAGPDRELFTSDDVLNGREDGSSLAGL